RRLPRRRRGLVTATEVTEAAWQMAAAALGSEPAPEPLAAAVTRLETAIEEERKPWLQALAAEANRRGVTLLADDKRISVGLGVGSRAWPEEATPRGPDRIPWRGVHHVPGAAVTGG